MAARYVGLKSARDGTSLCSGSLVGFLKPNGFSRLLLPLRLKSRDDLGQGISGHAVRAQNDRSLSARDITSSRSGGSLAHPAIKTEEKRHANQQE